MSADESVGADHYESQYAGAVNPINTLLNVFDKQSMAVEQKQADS